MAWFVFLEQSLMVLGRLQPPVGKDFQAKPLAQFQMAWFAFSEQSLMVLGQLQPPVRKDLQS